MISLPPFPNDPQPDWKGLTLRDMQMRRTLVQARMEIEKFKMSAHLDSAKSRTPFFGGAQSIFSRVTSVFTIAEYGYFAVKAFRLMAPLFRKRR